MPRLGTKRSSVFGKIPDWDWDHRVWSSPDRVPISLGLNFPNTKHKYKVSRRSSVFRAGLTRIRSIIMVHVTTARNMVRSAFGQNWAGVRLARPAKPGGCNA